MLIYLPTEDDIMSLHDVVLEQSGGRAGILDNKVISAAVSRPLTYISYFPDSTVHTVCAVLLDSLARNHAFVEGNKRTGLMTVLFTYSLNGIDIDERADKGKEFENLVLWVVMQK